MPNPNEQLSNLNVTVVGWNGEPISSPNGGAIPISGSVVTGLEGTDNDTLVESLDRLVDVLERI